MPTDRSNLHPKFKTKPWHARATVFGSRYSLGYYGTYDEAKQVEDEFRANADVQPVLSKSERQKRVDHILTLRAKGMTYAEIGEKVGLTNRQVGAIIRRTKNNA